MPFKPLAIMISLLALSSPTNDWQLPLDAPVQLVRHFKQPSSDYSAGHRGVDYAVIEEQPVFAAAEGKILYSGQLVNRSLVSISHSNKFVSEVEPVCSDLRKGDSVHRGQPIGFVCQPKTRYVNHCPGQICLHFSLRKDGSYLSPLALIGGLSPSRLLPYARG
jgi:murein DD-endopeptidase MepM/ murein hydrolase activator NlpD